MSASSQCQIPGTYINPSYSLQPLNLLLYLPARTQELYNSNIGRIIAGQSLIILVTTDSLILQQLTHVMLVYHQMMRRRNRRSRRMWVKPSLIRSPIFSMYEHLMPKLQRGGGGSGFLQELLENGSSPVQRAGRQNWTLHCQRAHLFQTFQKS